MNKFIAYSQIGLAVLLYLLCALTFFDYLYSLVIPDTVTAVENAFGKLVILVFMLVLAKFSLAAGKNKLRPEPALSDADEAEEITVSSNSTEENNAPLSELDSGQEEVKKEAEK